MISRLQALMRWGFMQVEALFNRAFGDRLNPYYHLGALTFFLFWIVAGTGLYLFAFFDTSVTGAYESVERLTHKQWFAGGIVRSVHRYASDAMVVTMVIHMARYFAFDRLRGFRWFSWVTGVFLIWMVYVAGANGYMLPWDQLAQYVTTASFEWLDWIPMFRGTLIRNFIYDTGVSDRLFSLLVFVHIGVPLLTLLLMWVHVQRVPKATTTPPKPIAISVVVMLLVMAVLVPVVSQGGPAHMATVPSELKLDWLLLALYPLVHVWSPAATWTLVIGISALLLVQPWLVWQRGRGAGKNLQLTIHPDARQAGARPGETILEAGLRAEIPLAYDCRSGGCGVCVCTVLNGKFEHGPYQPAVLTEAMRAKGMALMCCAVPLEDLELEVDDLAPLVRNEFVGTVVEMQRLAPEVMRVMVQAPPGQPDDFLAGQYLNVVLEDGEKRAFSFANPPHEKGLIELHVRLIPGGRFTTHVFEGMKVGDPIRLEGPIGRFTLRESERPILFLAGATGFAPVKSIIEDAFHRGITRPMRLYWGVRKPSDLYLKELAERWEREHENFSFIPVISHGDADDGWTGRRGLVHEAILADFPNLSGQELYACGSAMMIESAVPAFFAQGLDEDACFSDAFVPTPARAKVEA
ncbi:FAD-binding oxidoreductase [Ottowia sp.]|uniref:FAD-binding oxidoreductase n=1 Tax=Ottowia sp. TaxID=1898956 RepID=UPI002C1CACD8|nr:FAD-binding oxidoreductase [Ottowia sp.]HRN75748.1 cytochrome b N-terminal domain-containing protein [Ottowia sp.]HRQ03322.1 cytochrome b N-terminal domain-containing protein [Ottowia sp.]